jgi:hypothetical protein
VQTAAIGEDRIVLVDHRGGDLHIAARHEPPVLWVAVDTLTDAMDDLLVSLADRRHGGDVVALVLAAIAVAATAWRVWRRRFGRVHLVPAAVVGVLAGVLHASYAFARGSDLSVIGKTIVFSPLAAVGTGILVGCGAWCFLAARSWKGRLLGTIVATSVGWVGGLVALAIRGLTSVLIASSTGIGVWIYTIDLHHFIMSGLGCLVFALVFAAARRIGQPALTPPRRP